MMRTWASTAAPWTKSRTAATMRVYRTAQTMPLLPSVPLSTLDCVRARRRAHPSSVPVQADAAAREEVPAADGSAGVGTAILRRAAACQSSSSGHRSGEQARGRRLLAGTRLRRSPGPQWSPIRRRWTGRGCAS
eukprot:scaffold129782_cov75-Phaeocystis_antarctica.AAC.2